VIDDCVVGKHRSRNAEVRIKSNVIDMLVVTIPGKSEPMEVAAFKSRSELERVLAAVGAS
jgi:hypothetical protein